MSDPATDALIAQRVPNEWRLANDPTRHNRSKARQKLRQRYRHAIEFDAFRAEHPDARCSNCANAFKPQMIDKLACDLDSDFHGYSITDPRHVCVRWSPLPAASPDPASANGTTEIACEGDCQRVYPMHQEHIPAPAQAARAAEEK